ncbi:MAG: lipoyl domain-containing protein [Candidatus Omnitrophota bacterium]|nr:lipoyl domain-containing protein [Candidatus Omnitrophota bacterium]
MVKVVLPELGEGITKATVSYWFFKDGERVKEKDDLVELTTDKATFNLPSPCSGIVSEIAYSEGDTVNVGQILAVITEPTPNNEHIG